MRKIAIFSTKGGVAKTTTALNLAASLSILGKRVLLIDASPQNTFSTIFNINPQHSLSDLLLTGKTSIINIKERLNLITSGGLLLEDATEKIISKSNNEYFLKENLSELNDIDFIIVDCPPTTDLIVKNVLTFCTEVIVPISIGFLGQIGVNQVISVIDKVKEKTNPKLLLLGVLPVFYDETNKLALETVEMLKDFFGKQLFKTYIREDASLMEAPGFMKDIFEYEPNSFGAKDYMKLGNEILFRESQKKNIKELVY